MRIAFRGELMISNQWRIFYGHAWVPYSYKDMDRVGNGQYGFGVDGMGGWGIWMMSGGYGWGVADIDDRRIRHIFLKWGIGAKEGRYYTLYQLWPKQ